MRRDLVVIAIGNPFRRDDGAAIAVLERIQALLGVGSDRIVRGHCELRFAVNDADPVGLLEVWDGADLAVLLDAVRVPPHRRGAALVATPGRLHRLEADRELLRGHPGESASSHGVGLGDSIDLARVLDKLPDRLIGYAIEGVEFGYGHGLSDPVANAVPIAAQRVLGDLAAAGLDEESRATVGGD